MNTAFFIVAVRRGCAQTFRRPLPVFTSTVQYCQQSVQPVPAARLPYRVKVSAGKRYAWCACGHSKKQIMSSEGVQDEQLNQVYNLHSMRNQPFCDGAHRTKAPGISPLHFTPDKDRAVMLCACKQTKNAPYCDGTHLKVIFRDVVKSVKGMFK